MKAKVCMKVLLEETMDENYLDGLLNEVSSKPKQNKYFDNNVNSDSSVDIDMSDLDDISLDELDNLDDLDLGDFDLNDLDLDELDFDDLDITRLDVKNDKPSVDKSDDDFSLDDLINESEASEEIEETTEALDDYSFEDISEEQEVREEISDNNADADSPGFDLDELLGGATSSEDALFDSVFNEANNQLEEDTNVDFAGLDELTSGGEEFTGSDSFDLDDLFSALGIEEESTSESNPYTAGQDDLDALFESTNASAIELGELEDIEEVPGVKGKKKKNKGSKTKKTLSEIVFGEPDEDDFEEEEYLKVKQAEKEEKKEAKKAQKEAKQAEKQEKLSLKKQADKIKTDEKKQKKFAKQEAIRLELEAEKSAKKVPTPVVIIVFLAFAALGALVVLGSKEFNYAQLIEKAADYFERHRYRLAYDEVAGVDVKEEDEELRDRIYTVMYVERLYESYENNMSLARYDKALDALLRGLEKYDVHYEEAVELDIVEDIDYCRGKILTALAEVFGISEAQAYEIMNLEGQDYSDMLNECCEDFETVVGE